MFKNKNNYVNKLENELAKLKEENLKLKDTYESTQNYGLLSHIHDFLSDNNIHPSDIFLYSRPCDEFKITLTAVSGLTKGDVKRFFCTNADDENDFDGLFLVYYGVKININQSEEVFLNVSASGDGMFYSHTACERRMASYKFALSVAELISDLYKVEASRFNDSNIHIVIEEEDNLKLKEDIICSNNECLDLHSQKCYECEQNQRFSSFAMLKNN